jgi:predicted nucleic acid-binding protein
MADRVYFDTSVLVKRYVREEGSIRARVLLRRHRVVSSAVAPIELLSAVTRRRAAGDLSARESSAILLRARRDRAHWELVEVSALVLDRAEDLLPATGLRTLDALHLASAVLMQTASTARIPLVTADAPLGRAASAAGLDVIWVG